MQNGERLWWQKSKKTRVPATFVEFRNNEKKALIEEAWSGRRHEIRTDFVFKITDPTPWISRVFDLSELEKARIIENRLLGACVPLGELIRALGPHRRQRAAIIAAALKISLGSDRERAA